MTEISAEPQHAQDVAPPPRQAARAPKVAARGVVKRFGSRHALDGVSLSIAGGEVHALIGPNGAGKTTLLRILTGLVTPDAGSVDTGEAGGVGLVPSGDRSFYLRISAVENLVFFARLHGIGRKDGVVRARRALEAVGLGDSARTRVGHLSRGNQRRLALARGLLIEPAVLLVDEATHDLDPAGARLIRDVVRAAADARGIAVLWTTQRLEEVVGFADTVTLLDHGSVRFCGPVDALLEHAVVRRHVITIKRSGMAADVAAEASAVLGRADSVTPVPFDPTRYLLELGDGGVLGDVLAALALAGFPVVACRPDRSEAEEAFLALTERRP
jgi:ABC-2 type transport system ATP-binding protein